ncbi:MAG: hypothetical protein KBE23_06455 [Chloroflexi bacterium]|nr:hypothetical protein [Chloroflexota bacterium]MBP7042366.1 hypothetical protein [Chloroflexota bacterium]
MEQRSLRWKHIMKVAVICTILVLLLLPACAPQPEPLPAPLPTAEMVVAPRPLYFPAVIIGSEPVRGYARAYGALLPGEATRLGIEWYYDYGLRWPPTLLDNGAEYVPFFWCDQYPSLAWPTRHDYFAALNKLPDNYSGPLLFLNEPDLRGGDIDGLQCDRTPRQAAYIYKAVRAQCPRCRIIGPAASHEDYLAGWPWLKAFYAEITRLHLPCPDVAAIHDYTDQPPAAIVDSLFAALENYECAPQTAWVTEFSTCSADRARRMMAYYEQDSRIERYAWFTAVGYPAAPCYNLLDKDRNLSAAGEVFAPAAYP